MWLVANYEHLRIIIVLYIVLYHICTVKLCLLWLVHPNNIGEVHFKMLLKGLSIFLLTQTQLISFLLQLACSVRDFMQLCLCVSGSREDWNDTHTRKRIQGGAMIGRCRSPCPFLIRSSMWKSIFSGDWKVYRVNHLKSQGHGMNVNRVSLSLSLSLIWGFSQKQQWEIFPSSHGDILYSKCESEPG